MKTASTSGEWHQNLRKVAVSEEVLQAPVDCESQIGRSLVEPIVGSNKGLLERGKSEGYIYIQIDSIDMGHELLQKDFFARSSMLDFLLVND